MSQLSLLEVPKDAPSYKERINAFKETHGIWTNNMRGDHSDGKWCAMLLPKNSRGIVLPYVNDETDPFDIFAGYCRVLDEAGLLTDGPTERAAIETLCRNIDLPFFPRAAQLEPEMAK